MVDPLWDLMQEEHFLRLDEACCASSIVLPGAPALVPARQSRNAGYWQAHESLSC